MIALDGIRMGYSFVTLDPTPNSPLGQMAEQVTRYDDVEGPALAVKADVITYEFENVDAGVAQLLEEQSYVPQGSKRCTPRAPLAREGRIEAAGVPVAPYREITSLEDLQSAASELGLPCVLKTAMGGYDGKGQAVLRAKMSWNQPTKSWSPAGRSWCWRSS